MAKMNPVKLKTLKKTKNFYLWKLKRKESLTESERAKYLLALRTIDQVIKKKGGDINAILPKSKRKIY
ncbi:hypothetical protein ES705_14740 [subsurface metagenome]